MRLKKVIIFGICVNLIMPINIQGEGVKSSVKQVKYKNQLHIDIINNSNSDFYLGMKKEDVYLKIDELGLDTNIDSYENNYISINDSEKNISIDLYFSDINNNNLTSFEVVEICNTDLLTRGDSIEKMFKLYGYEYNLYQNRTPFYEVESEPFVRSDKYEFKLNNCFLVVNMKDNLVEFWEISQTKITDDFSFGSDVVTSSQKLIEEDLLTLSSDGLDMLRNYYFARHGYKFKNQLYLQEFSYYRWYTPKHNDVSEYLTPLDWYNVNLIIEFENKYNK